MTATAEATVEAQEPTTLFAGRRGRDAMRLRLILPDDAGKIKDYPALERFRVFRGVYYTIHANQCANWSLRKAHYEALCKYVGVAPSSRKALIESLASDIPTHPLLTLEYIGDKVMDEALKEQEFNLAMNHL